MGWVAEMMMAAAMPMAGMDHAPAVCPAVPAELVGWARMTDVTAGGNATGAPMLTIGVGARASLLPTPKVAYPLPPEKPGDPAGSGGLFAFAVPVAGRYRVALGSGAWIDVVRDGIAVTSAAHGHGPDCSGIRKMVDFDLRAGRYLLQIAGNAGPTLPLMVDRLR